jgi:tRNA(Ile)-lysidine synthase
VVAQAGRSAADDPSNRNTAFDRVRVRQALAGADWIDVGAWARSAENLADADAALDWAADREYGARVVREGLGVNYRPAAARDCHARHRPDCRRDRRQPSTRDHGGTGV